MEFFKFIIVFVLCIIAEGTQETSQVAGDGDVPIGPINPDGSTTSKPPTSPTATPFTTTPTTTTTTTTTTPTTRTTSTPQPTSSPVPTTTAKPTTSSSATTTTKPTPQPTTTSKPTPTTPAPNPGKPDVGTWNVTKHGTNITCILAKMALQIEVDYEEKNQTRKAVLNVPVNATANGTCDNNRTNQISIMWSEKENFTNYVTFNFLNNTNTSEVSLDHILVTLNGLHVSNATSPMNFLYNRTVFATPLKHSYVCSKEQTLDLVNPNNVTNCKAMLKVSQLQIEAFRTSNNSNFGDAINCLHSTPDIVPIAVGCALAALVVIVLLAYLYGRRRSQARGYLSMFAENKQEEDYIPMKTLSCFR